MSSEATPTPDPAAPSPATAADAASPAAAALTISATPTADVAQLGIASSPVRTVPAHLSPTKKGPNEKGPVKQALDLKYERVTGMLTQYDAEQGWGTVTSHLFPGEALYRSDRVMPEFMSHPFQQGEAIEFDVQADDHGNAQAVMVKPMVNRSPHDCLGQRHRGYVRRCAERWGFLNSAAFDGDLFVHRDNILAASDQLVEGQPPLRSGQAVEFDVALDDRGRAVARQITTHALPRPWDWIGSRLRGHVRSFQGAWGFIISDRFAGDLFVHRDSFLAEFQDSQISVGTVVEFDVERDQRRKGAKDRLVARRVGILGDQPAVVVDHQAMPQQQLAMSGMQQPLAMDPSAYMGALPQAANFGPQQQASMYYPQLDPAQMPYAQAYNPYAAQSPYMPQTMMQPQPQLQPQVFAQQYGQYQLPQVQPSLGPVPNAYLPAGVAPAAELPPALGTLVGQPPAVPQPAPATMPPAQAPGGEALGADGQPG